MYSLNMPLFPGERLADASELDDPRWADNAMPTFEEQTGLSNDEAVFTIVTMNVRSLSGRGWHYLVARPRLDMAPGARIPAGLGGGRGRPPVDPDRWWVFDEDVDETEGWIAQATFTPDGMIDTPVHRDLDDGDDPGGAFPEFNIPVHNREIDVDAPTIDRTPSRDPNAPVTVSIDLDEHESAVKEGIGAWEEHDSFGVLVNESGFAVVHRGGDGIVRYPDHTACVIKAGSEREARAQAEKFLAKRPYTTAYERVLGGPEFNVPEAPEEVAPAPAPSAPRPKPEKRVWNTVSMSSAEDDD